MQDIDRFRETPETPTLIVRRGAMIATIAAMSNGVQPGPESPLLVPAIVGLLAAVLVGVLVVVLRERSYRRRRAELETRLAGLEQILLGVSNAGASDGGPSSDSVPPASSSIHSAVAPRGPLSSVISTLRHDARPGLPGPDRVDLRAMILVYERIDRPTTPAELADELNLSLRSVQRGLSGSLGCTPRELILAVKMREAKRLLIEDDARVQEAARAVGFDDPFHFSRRFKAYYGLSPSEMQDRVNRNVA
jgi:AraC-like DNA-binding protein